MNDLKENESEFENIVKEIELGIKDHRKYKKVEIESLNNLIDRGKQILKSYKLDIRELPKTKQKPFQDKLNKYEEHIKTLENSLNWVDNKNLTTTTNEYQKMMVESKEIQQKDLKTVGKLLNKINEINNIGSPVLNEMAKQEEQMKRIDSNMEKVDNNLKMGNKYLNAIERR
ncbi:hypothetical protein RB653_000741 [Dictyostelium firmibasis]|uniref:t-SNARE coiled-coil homology domain-containing protein n=1 Tax=Dictyostelium firmibasis TaxID=79012 RepID=A0AAN7YY47_9MYCE